MESTGSREVIKSIMIMVGIPLAFSVTCSLFARITEKKASYDEEDNSQNVNHLKEQILTLRCKIKELQELERTIEVRFLRYNELKDQEYALMKVHNGLCVEKERAELLQREVSLMNEEKRKFDEMVSEYLNAMEELESARLENRVVRRREKKVLKKLKESLRVIEKKNLKIEAQEEDVLSKEVELKRKDFVIEGFECEVGEMRALIDRLQDEKNEVSNKLVTIENEVASKNEEEKTLIENYTQVIKELETIKKDRANELKELIYLRWCHACLRHELARRKELEQETKHDEEKVSNLELGSVLTREECEGHESDNESVVHHDEPFFGCGQQHTKRRWLVRKFKKWVEGNEKHREAKGSRSESCDDENEENHFAGRKVSK